MRFTGLGRPLGRLWDCRVVMVLLMIEILRSLKGLKLWELWFFLIMGYCRICISSTVGLGLLGLGLKGSGFPAQALKDSSPIPVPWDAKPGTPKAAIHRRRKKAIQYRKLGLRAWGCRASEFRS